MIPKAYTSAALESRPSRTTSGAMYLAGGGKQWKGSGLLNHKAGKHLQPILKHPHVVCTDSFPSPLHPTQAVYSVTLPLASTNAQWGAAPHIAEVRLLRGL